MEIISFFLPIRKNSKRIINKSFRPLYQYELGLTELKIIQFKKIKALFQQQIKNFKPEFIVSSDSDKVRNYIKQFKWIKFHKRSKWLSSDNSLDNLIKIVPKICAGKFILWTHVTSPLFNHKDYIKFITSFLKSKKRSAFTATPIRSFIYNQDRFKWLSHNRNKKKWPRTQDLDKIYEVNSAAFIALRSVYTKDKDRLDTKPLAIEIEKNKSLDIDNIKDLMQFKKILKND